MAEVVYAPWAKRVYKVHAFFFNRDALIVDRGVYQFETRTVEDTDWQWLSRQLDTETVVYGDICASDLQYEYLSSGIVLGRDSITSIIRLMLCPVN